MYRCLPAVIITFATFPLISGCAPEPPATTPALTRSTVKLTQVPVTMQVAQRSTTVVPGSERDLRLTVGDVTQGQVIASLHNADGESVLGTMSLRPDAFAEFRFGGDAYRLTLTHLDNAIIGEDTATFVIDDASPVAGGDGELTASEKISYLIEHIRSLDGTVFIRNGSEHAPEEAGNHMQRKLRAAGDRIQTADQFIEHVATRSSTTGRPYEIRLPDGTVVESSTYLRSQLRELEAGDP